MKSFISIASIVLSILSISLPVSALPADASTGAQRRQESQAMWPFTVAYGDTPEDEPADNILQVINGKSNDINHGFGGDYVWIVKHYLATAEPNIGPMCDFYFENHPCVLMYLDAGAQDLAKGAGGNCRWFEPETVLCNNRPYLTDAALWRAPGGTNAPPAGWSFISADLNGGRGGDYLYVVSR